MSHRDSEENGTGALVALFLCTLLSSRMFFGHHGCLDEITRYYSGRPKSLGSVYGAFETTADSHGAHDFSHKPQ